MEETSKKRKIQPYRGIRAHSNPLNDKNFEYPVSPEQMDWSTYFLNYDPTKLVEFADMGCGYGGLSVALSKAFPDKYTIGLELRTKVVEYVQERIATLRQENPGQYQNVAVIRANVMKNLPNYFFKGQLSKMFFLFPDPHFKKANHRRRVISSSLLAEYAYILQVGGILYTITDVEELYEWHVQHLEAHPLFQKIEGRELVDLL